MGPPAAESSAVGAQRPAGRLRLLDGLRIVAALAVLGYHFTAQHNSAWAGQTTNEVFAGLGRFTAYGALGVQLFFVISGFVILRSAWNVPIGAFAASRIGRLFPAYWLAVLFTGGLLIYFPIPDRQTTWHAVVVNLTMTQQAVGVSDVEGVYWTLWSELRFYVLIGVLMLIGITTRRVLALCALWPVAGALAATGVDLASGGPMPVLVQALNPGYAPLFAGGMALYVIYREGHSLVAWLVVGFDAILACQETVLAFLPKMVRNTGRPLTERGVWVCVLAAFVVVAVVTLTPAARASWRWLTTAGALTYPLYLTHQSFGYLLLRSFYPRMSRNVALLAVVAACLLLAWLIHRAVERPVGPWLRRRVGRGLSSPSLQLARPVAPAGGDPRPEVVALTRLTESAG